MTSAPLTTRTVKGRYRRPPASWLWLALLLLPLLAALLTWSLRDHPAAANPPGPAASSAAPTDEGGAADAAPVSVVGDGDDDLFVNAVVPDETTRRSLLEAVRSSAGDHAVVNRTTLSRGQPVADFAGLPALVTSTSAELDEFGVLVAADTVTVRGTARRPESARAVEQAARQAFPGRRVHVDVTGTGSAAGATPAVAPLTCGGLQDQIGRRLSGDPVRFQPSSARIDEASTTRLTEIGQALARCRATGIQVQGHTDATGSPAVNGPLSQRRAAAVREVLVAAGVKADTVTSEGFGSRQPVASGDTPSAHEQNRRVVVLVEREGR